MKLQEAEEAAAELRNILVYRRIAAVRQAHRPITCRIIQGFYEKIQGFRRDSLGYFGVSLGFCGKIQGFFGDSLG